MVRQQCSSGRMKFACSCSLLAGHDLNNLNASLACEYCSVLTGMEAVMKPRPLQKKRQSYWLSYKCPCCCLSAMQATSSLVKKHHITKDLPYPPGSGSPSQWAELRQRTASASMQALSEPGVPPSKQQERTFSLSSTIWISSLGIPHGPSAHACFGFLYHLGKLLSTSFSDFGRLWPVQGKERRMKEQGDHKSRLDRAKRRVAELQGG